MKHILMIGILALYFCSCDSFLKEYSQDLARVETISDLDELLIGDAYYPAIYIYEKAGYGEIVGEPFYRFIHFMTDEVEQNQETNDGDWGVYAYDEIFGYYTWQRDVGINPEGTNVRTENADWKKTYDYINVTNMILNALDEVQLNNEEDEKARIRIEGESRFLRALYYFTLVNVYADAYIPSKAAGTPGIPLKLTPYIEDKDYTSNTLKEVYEQILDDLMKAGGCLEKTPHKSLYRADINAVYLLLSRVYLYMQDYKNAQKYAQLVIDANYSLSTLNVGKENALTSSNPEIIFSMGGHALSMYLIGNEYDEGTNLFFISEDLVNAFEDDDLRKSTYIQEDEMNEGKYIYKKIYWGRAQNGSACSVSDNFLFRLSEAYLNFAEAAALDGDDAGAREKLGKLQAKRFLTPPSVTESGNALVDLIRKERQRELCLEGHRWFDLRRYTVCEKHAETKSITHTFTDFNTYGEPKKVRSYELMPNDPAYTLAFPKEVLDFQNTLGKNHRQERFPKNEEEIDE